MSDLMAGAEGPEKVRLVVGVGGSGKCWLLGWDTNERGGVGLWEYRIRGLLIVW